MSRLAGKVALITGGASGIGAACVQRFVAEGASVVFSDRDAERGAALAAASGAHFEPQDVCESADWDRVMGRAAERHGRLDVLVNSAGLLGGGSIEDVTPEHWNRVLGVNLTGVMLGCQKAIALMRRNPGGSGGSLINMASIAGRAGLGANVAYSATKGGVRLLTKSVAAHCAAAGLGIRCNAVLPGPTETPMLEPAMRASAVIHKAMRRMSPMGRMATADEVAAMVLFLASDESSFCNGADFVVDGGTLAVHPGTSPSREHS